MSFGWQKCEKGTKENNEIAKEKVRKKKNKGETEVEMVNNKCKMEKQRLKVVFAELSNSDDSKTENGKISFSGGRVDFGNKI